ncbi:MAG: hypothetical protein GF388_09100, partial [Candidatus Aegiribacteria sp.]|nr:hypothetical protein [Candidatus Aegiribacteria sp.]MBD3295218.1 hypothetical protein [Candidatus Fermentibacteria bacterium]
MGMNCPDFEVLMRYLDGELSPEERESVKEHLDSCPECLQILETQSGMEDAWRKSFSMPPEEAFRKMEDRVFSSIGGKNRWKPLIPVAAAILAALLGVKLILDTDTGLESFAPDSRSESAAEYTLEESAGPGAGPARDSQSVHTRALENGEETEQQPAPEDEAEEGTVEDIVQFSEEEVAMEPSETSETPDQSLQSQDEEQFDAVMAGSSGGGGTGGVGFAGGVVQDESIQEMEEMEVGADYYDQDVSTDLSETTEDDRLILDSAAQGLAACETVSTVDPELSQRDETSGTEDQYMPSSS